MVITKKELKTDKQSQRRVTIDYYLITFFSLFAIGSTVLFGYLNLFVYGDYFLGYIEFGFALLAIINVIILWKINALQFAKHATLILLLFILMILYVTGGTNDAGLFWLYTYPVVAFFLLGSREGLAWHLPLFGMIFAGDLLDFFGIIDIPFQRTEIAMSSTSLFVVGGMIYVFQRQRENISAKLTESRRGVLNLFNATDDFMCIANSNGYFERINPTFIKELGYAEEELLDHPFINFVHPSDKAKTIEATKKLSSDRSSIVDFQNRYKRKDGKYIYISWNARTDGGKIYAVARNITGNILHAKEEKKHIDELRRINELLVERELKMIELKKEIKECKKDKKAGKKKKVSKKKKK